MLKKKNTSTIYTNFPFHLIIGLALLFVTLWLPTEIVWAQLGGEIRIVDSSKVTVTVAEGSLDDMTPDGRYVVFTSSSGNITTDCTDTTIFHVFVYDRVSEQFECVSKPPSGGSADGSADRPRISDDGRYIAFSSRANNLVENDGNFGDDVFVHDHQNGTTILVSVGSDGMAGVGDFPYISADGKYVTFIADGLVNDDTTDLDDIYRYEMSTGNLQIVSLDDQGVQFGNSTVSGGAMSGDGNLVIFSALESSTFDDQIFLRDISNGQTEPISLNTSGDFANSGTTRASGAIISDNGRYVAFTSNADNLVSNDTNGEIDLFVRDIQNNTTSRVSVSSEGVEADADTSFARGAHSISADGRYIAFTSVASNLVPNDSNDAANGSYPDVFLRDQLTGRTVLVSLDENGEQFNFGAGGAAITADGRQVAFGGVRIHQLINSDLMQVNSASVLPTSATSFSVTVQVNNPTDETYTGGTATLALPNGLQLQSVKSVTIQQSLTQPLADIPPNGSATATWTVNITGGEGDYAYWVETSYSNGPSLTISKDLYVGELETVYLPLVIR